jgi:flagellar biosynthesis protein FlhG
MGCVLAIASGKGGVGKTFLSINLAHAFAGRGERVLLFDGDLGLANVDVQLGVAPRSDLGSVVSGRIELQDAVTPIAGGSEAGGFDILPGRSGSGVLSALSADEVARISAGLSALSLTSDRVILDLAAGVEPATLRLAASTDDVIVVVQDEPTSITDAYAFIKCLRARDDGATPAILINAADGWTQARRAADGLTRACQQFLGFTPRHAGTVRRDVKVRDAVRSQQLIAVRHPQSNAAQDIERVARQLLRG